MLHRRTIVFVCGSGPRRRVYCFLALPPLDGPEQVHRKRQEVDIGTTPSHVWLQRMRNMGHGGSSPRDEREGQNKVAPCLLERGALVAAGRAPGRPASVIVVCII